MKHLLIGILSIVSFVSVRVCSSDQTGHQIRIRNERSDKANVLLQMPGDSTITLNDIQPGQTTAYLSASTGTMIVTAVIQNEVVSHTAIFFGGKETRSTVVIQNGDPSSLRIDQ